MPSRFYLLRASCPSAVNRMDNSIWPISRHIFPHFSGNERNPRPYCRLMEMKISIQKKGKRLFLYESINFEYAIRQRRFLTDLRRTLTLCLDPCI